MGFFRQRKVKVTMSFICFAPLTGDLKALNDDLKALSADWIELNEARTTYPATLTMFAIGTRLG